ncbi:MAG: peptidoglycan-binding domain-containing protein [Pseudomonadota bacterium]
MRVTTLFRICGGSGPVIRCAAVALTLGIAVAFSLPAPADAADSQRRYAVKAAGNATCKRYSAAFKKRDPEFFLFAGYVHGFVSAVNARTPATYDIQPWQSDGVTMASLARACEPRPDERFANVVSRMIVSMEAQRLTEYSATLPVAGAADGRLYREVVFRLQTRLKTLGFFDGEPTSELDQATRDGLRAFQAGAGLEENGNPDQPTLLRLFYPKP